MFIFFLELFRRSTKVTPRSQMDPRIQGWEPLEYTHMNTLSIYNIMYLCYRQFVKHGKL
jgi:hypothetical protein